MKQHALLTFVLGCWLGGSVLMTAVIYYNFAGFTDLFDRNPKLAQAAGFDPRDAVAKKGSVQWVQASELTRVFFHAWNRTQIVLGLIALALALASRARRLPIALLALGLGVVIVIHLGLEPRVVDLGRQLDFLPRDPPPPMLDAFARVHGAYFMAETARFALVLVACGLLFFSGPRPPRAA